MNNSVKVLVIAVLLVGLLAGSVFLYNKYSDEYLNQEAEPQTTLSGENTTAEAANINPAPDFTVTDMNGNKVKLSDYKGKPVVVNFWATWCYYCKEEMPDFNEAYKENPDVQFLMVNATGTNGETVESAKAYVQQEKYEFPVFFDTDHDALKTYGVSSFPTTLFIDKHGNVVNGRPGMLTKEALQQEIDKIK